MFGEHEVAIITGIGPGMGRSIALGFARNGVDVVLAARRAETLDGVADEVRASGANRSSCPPTSPIATRARPWSQPRSSASAVSTTSCRTPTTRGTGPPSPSPTTTRGAASST